MSCRMFSGWLAVGCLLAFGCDASRPGGDFKTYDQLLTQETTSAADDRKEPEIVADDEPVSALVTQENADFAPQTADQEPAVETPVSAIAPVNVVDGTQASSILQVSTADDQPATADGTRPAAGPRTIELLVPEREFKTEGKPPGLRVSYDDLDLLKVLNMEPVPADATRHFPDWLNDLQGKQIRIRGFMYPTFESTGIEQFVLARDNQICCFGRDPKVYDLIAVSLQPGVTTDYIPNRPFDVIGRFRIEMLAEGGKPMGLYWLEDARVIDK